MKETILAYIEAINSQDIDAVMGLFAPDAELLNSAYRPATAAHGLALIRAYIQETVIQQHGRVTVLELVEKADAQEAKVELRSDRITQAGLSRIVGTEKFVLGAGKIKGFAFEMNIADEETKRFFDFVRSLEANRPSR